MGCVGGGRELVSGGLCGWREGASVWWVVWVEGGS